MSDTTPVLCFHSDHNFCAGPCSDTNVGALLLLKLALTSRLPPLTANWQTNLRLLIWKASGLQYVGKINKGQAETVPKIVQHHIRKTRLNSMLISYNRMYVTP